MTTMNTAATHRAMTRRGDDEYGATQRWALMLAVLALLGLAMLVSLGTDVQTAAGTLRAAAVEALGSLDATLAAIRWIR
jgi:hypothetical protein